MSNFENNRCNSSSIKIGINYVLTSKTCSNVIVEFIKLLVYQRLQIPYNFERLKYVVDKKKNKNKSQDFTNEPWHSSVYFKTTSTALEVMESIFKNLHSEFQKHSYPQEVCVLFGPNILCAKEAYRIIIPKYLKDHYCENHTKDERNTIHFALRYLVMSKELQNFFYNPLTLTNMFILFKKSINSDEQDISDQLTSGFFMPLDYFNVPSKVPEIVINLEHNSNLITNCCKQMKIFNDSLSNHSESDNLSEKIHNDKNSTLNPTESECWFRASVHLKGFQACFVNGQSVSETWIK